MGVDNGLELGVLSGVRDEIHGRVYERASIFTIWSTIGERKMKLAPRLAAKTLNPDDPEPHADGQSECSHRRRGFGNVK